MQNFISFLMALSLHYYQECPCKGHLSLKGYAQSSVPGALKIFQGRLVRVLIVRPSEAQARKPYDLYLSRIVTEFQNSFFKYKLWGFSSFSIFRE